jgi:hypothetical protein
MPIGIGFLTLGYGRKPVRRTDELLSAGLMLRNLVEG